MTPKHQTGLLFVYYITNLNLLEYLIFKLEIYAVFLEIHCPFANCTFYWVELHKFL